VRLHLHRRKASGPSIVVTQSLSPAALLEIGLPIVQIGYNQTSSVNHAGLNVAIWAILLNKIVDRLWWAC
jgi:hypothetical protein